MRLRDQLARFHAAITGRAPLDSARDLVEAGVVGEPAQSVSSSRDGAHVGARVDEPTQSIASSRDGAHVGARVDELAQNVSSRDGTQVGARVGDPAQNVSSRTHVGAHVDEPTQSIASSRDGAHVGVRVDELERLHVYEHAYTARIASVLVHDFPKLAALAGESVLRSWTAAYLRAYPPSNFSLREIGAHLARWLAEQRFADLDRRVLADLARLERARTEVFDGPDATPLSRDDLATLDPAEFPSLKLRLVPSSRVVELGTRADDVWDAIENDAPIADVNTLARPAALASDAPARHPSDAADRSDAREASDSMDPSDRRVVLVWRRELTVIHRTLDADEARIVPAMIAGTTFGAACELLDEDAAERAIELLVRWLDAQILQRS